MKNAYKIRLIVAILIFILALIAFFGIYPIKLMSVQFTPLLQKTIVDFTLFSCIALCLIVILTLIFGRFYCSTICPLGIFQELCALILNKKNAPVKNLPVKYFISFLTIGALIGGSTLLIRYIDPYTIFGSAESSALFGTIAVILLAILVFFKNRYFCTNICPVGAILGLISKLSINKIYIDDTCVSCKMCEKICPSGCINIDNKIVDNETCVKCLKCLGTCKKNALKFGVKPSKFSLKRRELILASTCLILFGGAIKAGAEISKKFIAKMQDVILPAGAISANRMANKCLNCNLCINICPNKILAKENKETPFVHIDYTKGEKFCKFDCIECSSVCPAGAIKKIKLEEKQNTRIAMASISDNCTNCGICVESCPKGAIIKSNDKVIINGIKCIGCNKCATVCPNGAIRTYAVKEQKTI